MGLRKYNVVELSFHREEKLAVNESNTYYTYDKKSTYNSPKEIERELIKGYMKLLSNQVSM